MQAALRCADAGDQEGWKMMYLVSGPDEWYGLILLVIITFTASMFIHELAHYVYARSLKKEVQYKLTKVIILDVSNLGRSQKIFFYLSGIAAGIIPIAASTIIIRNNLVGAVYFICLLVFYFVASNRDIKKIVRLIRS